MLNRLTEQAMHIMSKESNIDKLFRESLKDHQVGFNDGAWSNMEDMLDAREQISFWSKTKSYALVAISSIMVFTSLQSDVLIHESLVAESATVSTPSSQDVLKTTPTVNEESVRELTQVATQPSVESASVLPETKEGLSNPVSNVITPELLASTTPVEKTSLREVEPSIIDSPLESNSSSRNADMITMGTLTVKDGQVANEFAPYAPQDPVAIKSVHNVRHTIEFGVSNTFNHGLSNNSGLFGRNLVHSAFLQYGYKLKGNWGVLSGLAFSSKSGNGLAQSFNSTDYGFGKTTTNTIAYTQALQYIEIPLMAQLEIKDRHQVFAGLNASYLINSKHKVVENKSETLAGATQNTNTVWGMNEKFNRFDLGLRMGYDYNLNSNFKLGVNAQVGVIDVVNHNAWNTTNSMNNTEVQISLKYRLKQF